MDNWDANSSKRQSTRSAWQRWVLCAVAVLVSSWSGRAAADDYLSVYQDAHGHLSVDPNAANDQSSIFTDLTPEGDQVNTNWVTSPGADRGSAYARSLEMTTIPSSWVPAVTSTAQHAFDAGASLARDFLGDPSRHVNEAFCQLKGASLAHPPPPPFDTSGQAPRSQGTSVAPGATDAAKTNGGTVDSDPVNPFNGELVVQETDLAFPGFGVLFKQVRTYRSRVDYKGPMGYGWDHSMNRRLVADASGSCSGVTYSAGDGTSVHFSETTTVYVPLPAAGTQVFEIIYAAPAGVRASLRASGVVFTTGIGSSPSIRNEEWRLTTPEGIVQIFDNRGLMTKVEDLNHYGLTVVWEDGTISGNYRVAKVTDSVGREITYEYDASDRLKKVAHAASGLQATYSYEGDDLETATSSDGKTEHYGYDSGHPDDHDDTPAEVQLRATCDRMCGPAGSSCDASGVCDNVAAQAKAQCLTSCSACGAECGDSCHSYCYGSDGEGYQACVTSAGQHGEPSCDSQCRATCTAENRHTCDALFNGESLDPSQPPPQTSVSQLCGQCVDRCQDSCGFNCNNIAVCLAGAGILGGYATPQTGVASAIACFGLYGFEDGLTDLENILELGFHLGWDSIECAADKVCGWFGASCGDCDFGSAEEAFTAACNDNCTNCCAYGEECSETSCQAGHACKDDCRDAFYGNPIYPSAHGEVCERFPQAAGCLAQVFPACMSQCDHQCGTGCSDSCNTQCQDACSTACGLDDGSCVHDCELLDYVGECREGCSEECARQARHDAAPKYGHLRDLNHNLKTVFNVAYVPYLVNTYGQDPAKPNFDAVITQVNAGHAMSFEYRDLKGESLELVPPPASGTKIASFASPLSAYQSVEICPSVCEVPRHPVNESWLPWPGGRLTRVSGAYSPTGVGVITRASPAATVPPTLIKLSGTKGAYRASATTGGSGLPATLAFSVKLDTGDVIDFNSNGAGGWKLAGRDETIAKVLSDSPELLLGSDTGGVLRLLAGRPTALAYLSSGSCTAPFSASVTDSGQLAISPESACSSDFTVFPMASAVRNASILSLVSKGDNSTLSQADTFDPTALTAARSSTRWVSMGGGKFAATLGPADGGAMASLAAAERSAVNAAPILAVPSPPGLISDGRPLFAFHLPAELRPALDPKLPIMVWDVGDRFGHAGRYSCGDVGAPIREVGLRPRPALPDTATVVTDPYGVTWTYYYDGGGRTMRQVNQATQAVRSFNYDEIGDLVGVEEPLGDRTCLRYDIDGNILQSQQFPVPGAVGSTTPITRRWTYKAFPARPEKTFDPRDPTKVLTTYQWDDRGRIETITDATGAQTRFLTTDYGLPREIRGPSGSVETIEYDESAGLPSRVVTDASGPSPVVRTVNYDAAGRPLDATGPLGEVIAWTWDGGKLLATQTDADGVGNKTTYDIVDGQVHSTTHGMRYVEAAYDLMGLPRVTKATALDGSAPVRLACTSYGPNSRLLEQIRPDGTRVKYTYDGEGRLTDVTAGAWPRTANDGLDPACTVVSPAQGEYTSGSLGSTTYDKDGRAIVIRDAAGEDTHIAYDGFGRPAIVTDARGTSHRAGYDAMGNTIWTASFASTATQSYGPPSYADAGHGMVAAATATYDVIGRLSTRDVWQFDVSGTPIGTGSGAGHSVTSYAYRSDWNQVVVTDPVGGQTIQTVDGAGRLVLTQFATSDTEAITYLDGGRTVLREWSAPTQDGMLSERTILNAWGGPARRESNETGSLQVLQTWVYDGDKHPRGITSASGDAQTFGYDAYGELTASERRIGNTSEVTSVRYDAMGRVLLSTSDAGNGRGAVSSSFSYDVLGRLRTAAYPGNRNEDYTYKLASGLVATSHDPRGVTYTYAYTGGTLDSLTAVPTTDAATATQKLSYVRDALGRPVTATHSGASWASAADNVVTTLAYDSLGTPLAEWNSVAGQSAGVTTLPDALGRPRRATYASTVLQRQFDGLGRLTDLKLGIETTSTAQFAYDGLGGPISRTLSNGVTTTYGYDPMGRLESLTDARGTTQLAKWRWELGIDGVPRLAGLRKNGGSEGASVFQADTAARVLAERSGLTGLDSTVLAPEASVANSNSLTEPYFSQGVTRKYTYDGRSNWSRRTAMTPMTGLVTTSPTVDDKDAYTTFGTGVVATYDARGALKTSGSGTTMEQYSYDALGNMVSARKGTASRTYEYDAFGRRVVERDASGPTKFAYDGRVRAVRVTPDGQTEVIIDGSPDEHILRVTASGRQFYHQDRSHNVYLVTNSSGAAAEWYDYTAFGEMTIRGTDGAARTSSAIGNRLGYQGQPFDLQLGLIDMRARAYKPEWGRFMSPDPIGFMGGSNLYAFVGGAALSYWDPLGLSSKANLEKLQQEWMTRLANINENVRVNAMFDEENSFTFGDAIDIAREMPDVVWHGAKGLGQGAVDGVVATGHAILHPIDAIDGLGTFIGESTAKVTLGVEDIIENGFDLDAASDRAEQWLVSADPAEVSYGIAHATGAFEGGAIATAGAGAAIKAGLNVVKDATILNGLVAGEGAAGAAPQMSGPTVGTGAKAAETAAESQPSLTFRGDSRPPSDIFNNGFTARGTSTDVMAHALDNTNPPSCFISTTKVEGIASSFADNVYAVRPVDAIDVNQVLGPASPFPWEEEVAVPWAVSPQDIRGVTLVKQGVSVLNPNWRP